jgi:NAD(P)-dependent dehydrogenase (short-subunit alcohol dehydrogenase family)
VKDVMKMGTAAGKVAIVTGAGSGIGRATAVLIARHGAQVVVGDIDDTGGGQTVDEIRGGGGQAVYQHADVASGDDATALVARAVDEFGGLDWAVNNAGIEGAMKPIIETTSEEFDRVIAVNLRGVWLGMQAQVDAMLRRGGGSIVNVASVAGLVGFPALSPYVASKHGVVGLTRALALEYATQNIRVNAVCPGVIDTPMVQRAGEVTPEMLEAVTQMEPVGRMGTPEEIAQAIYWLCSDAASFITGEALAADGGYVAR